MAIGRVANTVAGLAPGTVVAVNMTRFQRSSMSRLCASARPAVADTNASAIARAATPRRDVRAHWIDWGLRVITAMATSELTESTSRYTTRAWHGQSHARLLSGGDRTTGLGGS